MTLWSIQLWNLYWVIILNSFLQFFNGHTGQNRSPLNPPWSKRSERCGLQLNSVTNFFVRARLTNDKNHYLCTKSSSTKLFLTWETILFFRTLLGSVHVLLSGCPSMQQSGLSFLLFGVPFFDLLSFLVHCCLCIWNQHCLG